MIAQHLVITLNPVKRNSRVVTLSVVVPNPVSCSPAANRRGVGDSVASRSKSSVEVVRGGQASGLSRLCTGNTSRSTPESRRLQGAPKVPADSYSEVRLGYGPGAHKVPAESCYEVRLG